MALARATAWVCLVDRHALLLDCHHFFRIRCADIKARPVFGPPPGRIAAARGQTRSFCHSALTLDLQFDQSDLMHLRDCHLLAVERHYRDGKLVDFLLSGGYSCGKGTGERRANGYADCKFYHLIKTYMVNRILDSVIHLALIALFTGMVIGFFAGAFWLGGRLAQAARSYWLVALCVGYAVFLLLNFGNIRRGWTQKIAAINIVLCAVIASLNLFIR